MSTAGVFAVDRGIWDDGDFADEPFTEREAWLWLISKAAWRDTTTRGNTGSKVEIKRAEFSIAVRFMAERWRWSKSAVDRFMQKIEQRGIVRDSSRDGSKIYFINNYNEFQIVGMPSRDSSGTAAGQQRDKEEALNIESSPSLRSGGNAPVQAPKKSKAPKPEKMAEIINFIPDWVPRLQWDGFVAMRKKIKAPLTEDAIRISINDLSKLRADGFDPAAVLEQSTQRGWRGIFKIGGDYGNRNGNSAGGSKGATALDSHLAGLGQLLDDVDAGRFR